VTGGACLACTGAARHTREPGDLGRSRRRGARRPAHDRSGRGGETSRGEQSSRKVEEVPERQLLLRGRRWLGGRRWLRRRCRLWGWRWLGGWCRLRGQSQFELLTTLLFFLAADACGVAHCYLLRLCSASHLMTAPGRLAIRLVPTRRLGLNS